MHELKIALDKNVCQIHKCITLTSQSNHHYLGIPCILLKHTTVDIQTNGIIALIVKMTLDRKGLGPNKDSSHPDVLVAY